MIDKLNKLDSNLNKLDELDKNKFCFNNFKEVNQQLEMLVGQIMSLTNIDSEKKLSVDEQVFLDKILSKIEKLETKILPKANLLNSFSQSII
jgi:ribosome assembly protein YihI (activator of Der GTPase)